MTFYVTSAVQVSNKGHGICDNVDTSTKGILCVHLLTLGGYKRRQIGTMK